MKGSDAQEEIVWLLVKSAFPWAVPLLRRPGELLPDPTKGQPHRATGKCEVLEVLKGRRCLVMSLLSYDKKGRGLMGPPALVYGLRQGLDQMTSVGWKFLTQPGGKAVF